MHQDQALSIAGRTLQSRLFVGTGKYANLAQMRDAITASSSEVVTVAIRRLPLAEQDQKQLLDYIPDHCLLLPNTAGCYSAQDAIRFSRMARELFASSLIKLEVLGDEQTLLPDVIQTLSAAKQLVNEGFDVMVYTNDDLIVAKRLEDLGCFSIMPLAAPIGSGLGIRNPDNIIRIVEQIQAPVIVDAGVGTASDAAMAMECGCDGVLMNTAIAEADDPVRMATAMKHAVIAGRSAYLAGRMPKRLSASASSPSEGLPK